MPRQCTWFYDLHIPEKIILAKIPEILYLAAVIRLFAEMTTTGIRSALTKIVGSQDVGKVIVVFII